MRHKNILIVAALTVIAALILALPFLSAFADARFQGAPLFLGTDESHYVVRLQQGLIEPFGNTSNGIFSVPVVQGLQPAGLEMILGVLFGWTGIPAGHLIVLLTILGGAAVLPLLYLLLRQAGVPFHCACLGSAVYVFLFLSPLRRVMHQSISFPLTLAALLFFFRFWEKPTTKRAVFAGIALGILPHVYYWSWTFAWAFAALVVIASIITGFFRSRWKIFALLGGVALLVALPYFASLASHMGDPLVYEAAERSSVIASRGWESLPRSLLSILLAVCSAVVFWQNRKSHALSPVFLMGVIPAVVLHQQLIHGTVISFSTHYYPLICLTSLIIACALFHSHIRSIPAWIMMGVSLLFLGAAAMDYSGRWSLMLPDQVFSMQHLKTAYPLLGTGTVLTDQNTALAVASNTRADVVFTEHARHLLISTREYAERYCLSTLSAEDANAKWIPEILREPSKLGRVREEEMFHERQQIATDACRRVRGNPERFLRKYRVTELLWNSDLHPEWKISTKLFAKRQEGTGWSLWSVRK